MSRGQKTEWMLPAVLEGLGHCAVVLLSRQGRVLYWNDHATRLFQHTPTDMIGRSLDLIYTLSDRSQGAFEQELQIAAREGQAADSRWHQCRDGAQLWIEGSTGLIRRPSGQPAGFVKVMRDATDRKRYDEQIARLARVDLLTGVGNRHAFDEQLHSMAESAARHGNGLVLHLVDLDHFKEVNDRLGHAAGDEVLQEAAQRILGVIRKNDFIARLGGDEFAVLQSDLDDPKDAAVVAQKLVDVLGEAFYIQGSEIYVGASIGVAVWSTDTADVSELLRLADAAMYRIKHSTRGGYALASRTLDKVAQQRSRDRSQLIRAFRSRSFMLHYQPQVDAITGEVRGLEALLRCTDPKLAHRSVDEIVDLARSTGLMQRIGLRSLKEACAQAQIWQESGLPTIKICLNFGADEMADASLVAHVNDALAHSGLEASTFEVELTEKHMFDYTRLGHSALEELRSVGLTVAIDDFGTGYSALTYLTRLPVDRIKLDRTFVSRLPDDPQSCAMAQAIIGLAHALSLQVVAEGVETRVQAEYLEALGCEALQGYLYCRPLPADEMTRWLQARDGRESAEPRALPH